MFIGRHRVMPLTTRKVENIARFTVISVGFVGSGLRCSDALVEFNLLDRVLDKTSHTCATSS